MIRIDVEKIEVKLFIFINHLVTFSTSGTHVKLVKSNGIICLLTDFGLSDKYTGILKGVACSVDPGIRIHDLTHQVAPFNIRQASWLLSDIIAYWPEGTTFAAIVDPGVGSGRKCLAIITGSGHYLICPDNGLSTFVAAVHGIREIRYIDILKSRLPGREVSPTFQGRDIFIYNAALLASGKKRFEQMGFLFTGQLVSFKIKPPEIGKNKISGEIVHIEEPFGNLCTNIRSELLDHGNWKTGTRVKVTIRSWNKDLISFKSVMASTFSDVAENSALVYVDSAKRIGLALNSGNMCEYAGLNSKSIYEVRIEKQ
jgi:S-adenosylmethionine hydrolase